MKHCRFLFSPGKRQQIVRLFLTFFFPQIALAIGVLTSSCRFCGFVAAGGDVTQGVVGGVTC